MKPLLPKSFPAVLLLAAALAAPAMAQTMSVGGSVQPQIDIPHAKKPKPGEKGGEIVLPEGADAADICNTKGDPDNSIAACTVIIQNPKTDPDQLAGAYNNRGNAYEDKGMIDQAMADFNQALTVKPDYNYALNGLGVAYYRKRDLQTAIQYFDASLAQDPTYAEPYTNRGNVYLDLKEYDKAFADYSKVIELKPTEAKPLVTRGEAYKTAGKYDLAIADYNAAIALDPKYADAYTDRGSVYRLQGDYAKAMADFEQALVIDPNNAAAYANRGAIYDDQKKYDIALDQFTKAIKLDSKLEFAFKGRGNVFKHKGKYEQAIADYDQAIALKPEDASAHVNRGLVNNLRQEYDRALRDFDIAVKLDYTMAKARTGRAQALFNSGYFIDSAKDFARALELEPNDPYTVLRLYDARGRMGKLSDAELKKNAARLDLSKWPGPVIKYYMGKMSLGHLRAAANKAYREDKDAEHCIVEFYVGEYIIVHNNRAGKKNLAKARNICPKTSFEWRAAHTELDRLPK